MATTPPRCPITQEPVKDPVIAPDYHIYERSAIEQWLRTNPTSPLTRQPMRLEDLQPIGKPSSITTPLLATTVSSSPPHNSQKMIIMVCPIIIGVIILIFVIRQLY